MDQFFFLDGTCFHTTPLGVQHRFYVGVCMKSLLPRRVRSSKANRTKKATAFKAYLVVPQNLPHPHKETKRNQDYVNVWCRLSNSEFSSLAVNLMPSHHSAYITGAGGNKSILHTEAYLVGICFYFPHKQC